MRLLNNISIFAKVLSGFTILLLLLLIISAVSLSSLYRSLSLYKVQTGQTDNILRFQRAPKQ